MTSTTGSLAGSGIGVDVSVEGTSTTGSEIAGIAGTSGVTGTTGSTGLAAAIWSNILVLSNAGSASAGFTSSFASGTTGVGSCAGAGSAGVCTIVSDVTAGSGVTLTSGVSEGVSIVNELSKEILANFSLSVSFIPITLEPNNSTTPLIFFELSILFPWIIDFIAAFTLSHTLSSVIATNLNNPGVSSVTSEI